MVASNYVDDDDDLLVDVIAQVHVHPKDRRRKEAIYIKLWQPSYGDGKNAQPRSSCRLDPRPRTPNKNVGFHIRGSAIGIDAKKDGA